MEFFFNPNAGNGNAEKLAKKMQEKFKQAGHEGEFLTAPDPEKAVETVKEAIEEYDGIVAIGGDGSLNIVGTAFVQAGKAIPLGIIPGGTINNFAKRWHLPMDEEEAMDIIIAGYQRKVGIAACQDRQKAVISSFTFGSFADISNEVRQSEKKKFGLIVYPLKALKQLGKDKSYPVEIKTDNFHENWRSGSPWRRLLIQLAEGLMWIQIMMNFMSAFCTTCVFVNYSSLFDLSLRDV